MTTKWAQTLADQGPNRVSSLDPSRIFLRWERRSYEGLGYDLKYSRVGPEYEPALGFEGRDTITGWATA